MHIDSSLVPLAPGKVLVNFEYMDPAGLPPADAEAVAKGLKERGNLLLHERLNVKTLVDQQANADQIEKTS
jgi:hypothetical protein